MGQRLAAARQAKGLTLVQLGALIGIEPSTINRWENGQSSPRDALTWGRLAEGLQVDLDYIIRGTAKESYSPGFRDAINVARGRINVLLDALSEEHNG